MSKFANLSGLMSNSKSRSVIFITLTLVLLVGLVAFIALRRPAAQLPSEIRGVRQVVPEMREERQAGPMNPNYQELFDRQNEINAKTAEETGSSHFLKIGDDPAPKVEAPKIETPPPPAPAPQRTAARTQSRPQQNAQPAQPHPALKGLIEGWQVNGHHVFVDHVGLEYEATPLATFAGAAANGAADHAPRTVYYRAGQIAAATMINTTNSDNPGSMLARIHSGPFAGGSLIGSAKSGVDGVGVGGTFHTLVAPDGREFDIKAEALSEGDLSNMLATDIDHKLFNRFVFRPLAYFLEGMADAVLANVSASRMTIHDSAVTTIETEPLDTAEQARVGLGKATGEMVKDLEKPTSMRPTTTVARNEVFAVAFLAGVTDKSIK